MGLAAEGKKVLLIDADPQGSLTISLSYFDKTIQKWLNEYIRENVVIKPIQIAALRERAEKENIDQEKMIMILHNALPGRTPAKKVVMNEKKLALH